MAEPARQTKGARVSTEFAPEEMEISWRSELMYKVRIFKISACLMFNLPYPSIEGCLMQFSSKGWDT